MNKLIHTLALFAVIGISAQAQDKMLTIQDAILKGRTTLAPKRLQSIGFAGNEHFGYIDNNSVMLFEAATGKQTTSLSIADINAALKKGSIDTVAQLEGFRWKDANGFYFNSKKTEYLFDTKLRSVSRSERKQSDATLENLDEFKEGEVYAYVKDNNVFVSVNGKVSQVTKDGSYEIVNGKSVHRDEFGIHKGTYWSPNGNYLAYYRMDQHDVTDYPVIDWTTYPAVNKNIKYPMAGNKSHYVTLHVYDIKSGAVTDIRTEGPAEQYLTNIAWSPDEKFIYIDIVNRAQNQSKLNEYDARTGAFTRTLFEENDEKYIEPLNPMLFVKNDPGKFIWQSRRDGYNHFYLYDIKGKLIRQLTKGNWEVKAEGGFDEKGERLFFFANAEKPVCQDFYSVEIKSGKMKRITSDAGIHSGVKSLDGKYFIDNYTATNTTTRRLMCLANTVSCKPRREKRQRSTAPKIPSRNTRPENGSCSPSRMAKAPISIAGCSRPQASTAQRNIPWSYISTTGRIHSW
jgi:dipeptidyl-peptidase 4